METRSAQTQEPSTYWPLATLSLSMLMPSLETSIANAGLPTLAQAFDASFQEVQWVVLSYLLVITTMIVSVGRFGDIIGRRRLLLSGVLLFTLASLLCGWAPSLWILVAARAAQGLGAATMMALTLAMVGGTVSKEKTGSAMGLLGTMSALGTTLGPSLGGILITEFGWHTIFLINVPLGLLNFFLIMRYLPRDRKQPQAAAAGFDIAGMLILAATLAAYSLAMTIGHGRLDPLNLTLLGLAFLGALLFVFHELKTASPLIQFTMFQDSSLSAGLAMSGLVATVMMTTLVVGPFYLSSALGLKPAWVGFALSTGPLVAAVTGLPAGRIVDAWGTRRMTLLGLGGMAAGAFLLSLLPQAFGIAGYLVPIAMMTSSYALFQAANNTQIMTGIRPERRGVISGLLSLSRNLGLITGASAMGAIFAAASQATELTRADPEAVAQGMHFTFAVAGGLIVLALGIATVSRRFSQNRLSNA
ncbi:MAG TPA: MFS transporter [Oligoflexus sp.]|uniref:MFS transporter n=1 Tax=Oligoflexus sp. TaxID=1971216 RepID=UPI002D7E5CBB|nr:MFS transporter [Oligoflexus sp.]HET9237971.1 MFS transporter [Oligoflexus sp.]